MFKYIGKRIVLTIYVLIGVTVLSFLFSSLSPVDSAEAKLIRSIGNPTDEQVETLRQEMGLDGPVYKRYINWIGNFIKGDLGDSMLTGRPVLDEIGEKLPVTIKLISIAFMWVILLTIPISILCVMWKDGPFDHIVRIVTIMGIPLPSFWLGFILLLVFAVKIPIFKVVDYGGFKSTILPTLTIAIPTASTLIRLLRTTMLANISQDYVVYAKARGLSQARIMFTYVLKNSMPPIITLVFQHFGYMIAGSAIIETVFSWPGIGRLMVDSIAARDLPIINGCLVVIALIFVFSNLIADIINISLNPKTANEILEAGEGFNA